MIFGNGDEDGNGDDRKEYKVSELLISVFLKKLSSVFIPFASSLNLFFSFFFLHTVVLEFPVYTALMLFAAPSLKMTPQLICEIRNYCGFGNDLRI